jgi:hypothetical protein
MELAQLIAIRQNLDKACRLVKPRRAALEAFTGNLITFLAKTQGQQSLAQVKAWLRDILPGTCFAPDYQEHEGYSSPVCYAQVPGMREGFEDAGVPEPPAPPANRIARNPDLREALQATLYSVSQILSAAPGSPPANVALEKQLTALVYQLYELSPEEIAAFERP